MDLIGMNGPLRQVCFKNFVSKESEPWGGMSWPCPSLDLPMIYTEKYKLKMERKNYIKTKLNIEIKMQILEVKHYSVHELI